MRVSRKATLEIYDESTDEHRAEEYYQINPEENYEGDFNDDNIDIEFDGPDFFPACSPLEALKIVLTYRATIDQCDEIPELIMDIRTSNCKKFEVHAKEICYDKFFKAVRSKIPDLRIDISKVQDGQFVFKMEF